MGETWGKHVCILDCWGCCTLLGNLHLCHAVDERLSDTGVLSVIGVRGLHLPCYGKLIHLGDSVMGIGCIGCYQCAV